MTRYLKNFWVIIPVLIVIAVSIINLLGGVRISDDRFQNFLKSADVKVIESNKIYVKIGFGLTFVAKDVSIKIQNFDFKAEEMLIKKSLFGSGISDFTIINGNISVFTQKEDTIYSKIFKLREILFPSHKTLSKKNALYFKNTSLFLTSKDANLTMAINNFNGEILGKGERVEIEGDFELNNELYKIEGSIGGNNDFGVEVNNNSTINKNFAIAISGDNLTFRAFLNKENKGEIAFSVNNITNFLNILTPNTLKVDFGDYDGIKNALYFKTNFAFNDVRKSLEFNVAKIQLFGGKEEDVIIENSKNDIYKIFINIDSLKIAKEGRLPKLIPPASNVPSLQFGQLIPEITVLFDVKINEIELAGVGEKNIISNISASGRLGYGEVDFNSFFVVNEGLKVLLEGFLYNYESPIRKSLVKVKLEGRDFNLSNTNIIDSVRYKGGERSHFKSSFNFVMLGETGILDDIYFEDEETLLNKGRVEFNLYLKDRSYFLDANFTKLNVNKIKLITPSVYTGVSSDLFRTLFDYLKVKAFANINLNCDACKMGDENYQLKLKSNISGGKFEISEFKITNENIDFNSNILLDIRNLQNNLANLNINVAKWNNFNFANFLKLGNILERIEDFKMPSLEGFSGVFNLKMQNVAGMYNKLNNLALTLSMVRGELKEASSFIDLNGFKIKDFISIRSFLNEPFPRFSFTASIPSLNLEGFLKFAIKDEKFDSIKGLTNVSIGGTTKGVLFDSLISNLSANININSNAIEVKRFNVEELSGFMSNQNSVFKGVSNRQITDKMLKTGIYAMEGKMSFQQMEFNIEKIELKSATSNSIFVGRLGIPSNQNFFLQLVGKTATVGANLNNKLNGLMPLYISSAITNEGQNIKVNLDYSQIYKYSEARRVLYK
jgi:hypothetical protein